MRDRKLEVWQLAREWSGEIHQVSLDCIPKFEIYEERSQIRRSMMSVRANIVENYGRRRYKQNFIRSLAYAHASDDETIDHLETLHETGSLNDPLRYEQVHKQLHRSGDQLKLTPKEPRSSTSLRPERTT